MSVSNAGIQKALEAADSLNFLKASFGFDLSANGTEPNDYALYKHLGQFYFNYHSALSLLSPKDVWGFIRLNANTQDFRNLDNKYQLYVLAEDKRIKELFLNYLSSDKDSVILCMIYANYWLRLADGFRVSFWLYRVLDGIGKAVSLTDDLMMLKNDLYEMAAPPIEKTINETALRKAADLSVYVEFEKTLEFVESSFEISISDLAQQFVPRFRDLFQLLKKK